MFFPDVPTGTSTGLRVHVHGDDVLDVTLRKLRVSKIIPEVRLKLLYCTSL